MTRRERVRKVMARRWKRHLQSTMLGYARVNVFLVIWHLGQVVIWPGSDGVPTELFVAMFFLFACVVLPLRLIVPTDGLGRSHIEAGAADVADNLDRLAGRPGLFILAIGALLAAPFHLPWSGEEWSAARAVLITAAMVAGLAALYVTYRSPRGYKPKAEKTERLTEQGA